MTDRNADQPDVVRLAIPCRAEYVGVARLAILGVASRLSFSYDDVEDLRLAVGEACAGAIDAASPEARKNAAITISCEVYPQDLVVEINYNLAPYGTATARAADDSDMPSDVEGIGSLLMEILVDSAETTTDPVNGTTVRLVKKVQPL